MIEKIARRVLEKIAIDTGTTGTKQKEPSSFAKLTGRLAGVPIGMGLGSSAGAPVGGLLAVPFMLAALAKNKPDMAMALGLGGQLAGATAGGIGGGYIGWQGGPKVVDWLTN